jgi:hypothetical protein
MALVAGTIATRIFYALTEDGNLLNPALFLLLSGATLIATAAFCAARHFFSTSWIKVTVGVAGSYCAWLIILLASGPETAMWLPVIILVGVPFTAPVLIGAWVGSGLLMPMPVR